MISYIIDKCQFGLMVINGEAYQADLIITPERIISDWWRKEGHLLQLDDLEGLITDKIYSVFIGTGFQDKMKVDSQVIETLEGKNIPFILKKTPVAVKEYNRHINKNKIGIFHLTC